MTQSSIVSRPKTRKIVCMESFANKRHNTNGIINLYVPKMANFYLEEHDTSIDIGRRDGETINVMKIVCSLSSSDLRAVHLRLGTNNFTAFPPFLSGSAA